MAKNEKLIYKVRRPLFGIPLLLVLFLVSCGEQDTKLVFEGGNPPEFALSGSGKLIWIRIRGGQKQREAEGEDQWIYWEIKADGNQQFIEKLSPITYGIVPKGYKQVYPAKGQAPPLIEGERYNIWVWTLNANGVERDFIIRSGKTMEVPE
jgi:hypothetical protein